MLISRALRVGVKTLCTINQTILLAEGAFRTPGHVNYAIASSGTAVNIMFCLAVFGEKIQQSDSPSWYAHIHNTNHPLRWNCHVRSCSCSQSRWENICL